MSFFSVFPYNSSLTSLLETTKNSFSCLFLLVNIKLMNLVLTDSEQWKHAGEELQADRHRDSHVETMLQQTLSESSESTGLRAGAPNTTPLLHFGIKKHIILSLKIEPAVCQSILLSEDTRYLLLRYVCQKRHFLLPYTHIENNLQLFSVSLSCGQEEPGIK